MTSITDLIGRPYAFPSNPPDTFDCFSVTQYIRKLIYGRETPIENATVHGDVSLYRAIAAPVAGCVVSMMDEHVGVFHEGCVVTAHKSRGVLAIRYEVARRVYKMRFWEV